MVFAEENRNNEHRHWILHIRISPSTKYQLKLIIWDFLPKFTQKGHFRSKTEKGNTTIEFYILKLVKVPNFSLNWQFYIFGPNLPQKGVYGLKQKSPIFACVHGRYLLYLTFPYRGQHTQRYSNVSFPSSHRDNHIYIIKCNRFCLTA